MAKIQRKRQTNKNIIDRCKYRANDVFIHRCSISGKEIEYDMCLNKRNFGHRMCPVSGCCPEPNDIKDLLKVGPNGYWKLHSNEFPEDVIYSGCKYFEKGRTTGGGNSLVAMR